jgi:hypothetical protein
VSLPRLRKGQVSSFDFDRRGPRIPRLRGEVPASGRLGQGTSKKRYKDFIMDKDYFNILVFGHTPFGVRRLRIKKESFRMGVYLLFLFQLSITFFFCDYIQVRKKTFLLNQLHQESQIQKSHIQLFSTKIEELEKKLSRLKNIDQRIRIIANLEKGQENLPFIGMGGPSPSVPRRKSKEELKESE